MSTHINHHNVLGKYNEWQLKLVETDIHGWHVEIEFQDDGSTSGSVELIGSPNIGCSLAYLQHNGCAYDACDQQFGVEQYIIDAIMDWAYEQGW